MEHEHFHTDHHVHEGEAPRAHSHGGHHHAHGSGMHSENRLRIALAINAAFLVVEVIGGLAANSLALLSDAGHMLTDVAALVLALWAARLARRVATPARTYGLLRAEVLGAFVNGASLMAVVGVILWQAWKRIGAAPEISGGLMLVVAVLGLAANVASAMVLFRSRGETLNIRAAFLHMMADTLGSAGAIIAGVVVITTGWTPMDTIASVVIAALIFWGAWGLLAETVNILLESTPGDIDYHAVRAALENIEHIKTVSDLHIWTIASGVPALSAHVRLYPVCGDTTHWQICLKEAQDMLRERFGIRHSTLQFEPEDFVCEHPVI